MKKIAAWVCIGILGLTYLAAFVLAIVDKTPGMKYFGLAATATIVVPIMTWIYMWIYKKVKENKENNKIEE